MSELKAAEIVILMLSKRSVKRAWVYFEAGGAWLTEKKLVPVCYGNLSRDGLTKPYSDLHALNLRRERYFLTKSIAHHLGLPTPSFSESVAALAARPSKDEPISTINQLLDKHMSIDDALDAFQDEA